MESGEIVDAELPLVSDYLTRFLDGYLGSDDLIIQIVASMLSGI